MPAERKESVFLALYVLNRGAFGSKSRDSSVAVPASTVGCCPALGQHNPDCSAPAAGSGPRASRRAGHSERPAASAPGQTQPYRLARHRRIAASGDIISRRPQPRTGTCTVSARSARTAPAWTIRRLSSIRPRRPELHGQRRPAGTTNRPCVRTSSPRRQPAREAGIVGPRPPWSGHPGGYQNPRQGPYDNRRDDRGDWGRGGGLAGLIGAGEVTSAIPSLASRRFSTYSVVFVGNNMPVMWQNARGPDLLPFSGTPHPDASTC